MTNSAETPATGGTDSHEQIVVSIDVIPEEEEEDQKKFVSMADRLMADLVENRWPFEEKCKKVLGKAHLGVIPLPKTEDSYEQP